MKTVTLSMLAERLADYSPLLVCEHNRQSILTVIHVGAERVDPVPGILYLVYGNSNQQALAALVEHETSILFFCDMPDGITDDIQANILLLQAPPEAWDGPIHVANAISEFLLAQHKLNSCAHALFLKQQENPTMQEILDVASQYCRNAVTVFDTEFKLLASIWDDKLDETYDIHLRENQYLGQQAVEAINAIQSHKKVLDSDKPVLVKNPNLKHDRIVANIKVDGKSAAILAMIEGEQSFTDFEFDFVALLGDVIGQLLERERFTSGNRGKRYEYFIADLLDGKIRDKVQYQERIANTEIEFMGSIYLTVVRWSDKKHVKNIFEARGRIEQIFHQSHSLLYKDDIVVITTRKSTDSITVSEWTQMENLCDELGVVCGMSNCFHSADEIPAYYEQALMTIDFAAQSGERKRKPGLYAFKDYAIDYLTSQLKDSDILPFCHPHIRFLFAYDKKHSSDFAETLYAYLLHAKNTVATSEYLYIHRNTLRYRLNQLKTMLDIDYDDHTTTLYLIISHLAMRRQEAANNSQ